VTAQRVLNRPLFHVARRGDNSKAQPGSLHAHVSCARSDGAVLVRTNVAPVPAIIPNAPTAPASQPPPLTGATAVVSTSRDTRLRQRNLAFAIDNEVIILFFFLSLINC